MDSEYTPCLALAVMQGASRLSPLKDWQRGCAASRTSCVENDGFQCGYCTPDKSAPVALLDEVKRGASAVTADLANLPN